MNWISVYAVFLLCGPIAGIIFGAYSSLAVYGIFEMAHYIVVYSFVIVLFLVTICVSYLAIRTRLNHEGSAFDETHNRQSVERNTKLSKTVYCALKLIKYRCVYCFLSYKPCLKQTLRKIFIQFHPDIWFIKRYAKYSIYKPQAIFENCWKARFISVSVSVSFLFLFHFCFYLCCHIWWV